MLRCPKAQKWMSTSSLITSGDDPDASSMLPRGTLRKRVRMISARSTADGRST